MARPLKFTDPDELGAKIAAYFESCLERWSEETDFVEQRDDRGKVVILDGRIQYDEVKRRVKVPERLPTISGLAVWLDCDRDTLLNYQDKESFFGTIKRAKEYIQYKTEEHLGAGKGNTAGIIFSLKNNWGWKDRTETDLTSGGERVQGYAIVPPKKEEGEPQA